MPSRLAHILILIFLSINVHQISYGAGNEEVLKVSKIKITGNALTSERVILRELPFQIGDSLHFSTLQDYIKQSTDNLTNTLLFNFISVSHSITQNNIEWHIDVEERWYIWPFPIFEYDDRNFSAFLKNGDLSRINYGIYLRVNNFRGMNELLKVRAVWGYQRQIDLQYITYNLDKGKRHGLSAWVSYFTNNEVNYATANNKPLYYRSLNGPARRIFFTKLSYHYRPKHHWYHTVTLGYVRGSITDSLAQLNSNYLGDGNTKLQYNLLLYEAILDKRNSKIFPLGGYLVKTEFGRQGSLTNKTMSFWYAQITGGVYGKIFKRVYAGSDLMGKINTRQNLPYFANEAIGYTDFIRGYEHYVTNGSNFFINKNSLKFELLPSKVFNLPLIPDGKFKKAHLALYWSLFADTGYVKTNTNSTTNGLEDKFLYGYGTGLYIVAYYDIVFRIEYSFNGLGESGLFFHFGTPFLTD